MPNAASELDRDEEDRRMKVYLHTSTDKEAAKELGDLSAQGFGNWRRARDLPSDRDEYREAEKERLKINGGPLVVLDVDGGTFSEVSDEFTAVEWAMRNRSTRDVLEALELEPIEVVSALGYKLARGI